jgi:hypothetical protein
MDIFDNFLSPRVYLRCLPFRNANLVGRSNAAYARDPRGLQPALPDRFLKAVGSAQFKVLLHHHAHDAYPSRRCGGCQKHHMLAKWPAYGVF